MDDEEKSKVTCKLENIIIKIQQKAACSKIWASFSLLNSKRTEKERIYMLSSYFISVKQ